MKKSLVISIILLAGCARSHEAAWVEKRREECHGLGGDRFSYVDKIAYCSRKPMLRMPKTLFEKKYNGI